MLTFNEPTDPWSSLPFQTLSQKEKTGCSKILVAVTGLGLLIPFTRIYGVFRCLDHAVFLSVHTLTLPGTLSVAIRTTCSSVPEVKHVLPSFYHIEVSYDW